MEAFQQLLNEISAILWGPYTLIPLLLGTGVYLTIRLNLIQVRKFWSAFRLAFFDKSDEESTGGDISQFQALATALAATVGVGNIVGIASVIHFGGPGAIFWMWVTGLVGMASKYSEAFLGVRFRTVDEAGECSGGPQYYLSKGIPNRFGSFLAIAFSVFAAIAAFGIGNMVQGNAIAVNLKDALNIPLPLTGVILALLVGLVLIGGISAIGRVTSLLVPFMVLAYVVSCLIIIGLHGAALPGVLEMIFADAFTGTGIMGGFGGATMLLALQYGVARSLASNESGMGSGGIAAAAARTAHPVRQGMVSMTQTFIDTLIVLTCTSLVLLTTGVWTEKIDPGIMTNTAFNDALPGGFGHWIVIVGIVLYAFSTILGWAYYGERCMERLAGRRAVRPYRLAWCVVVFVGATIPLETAWALMDVMNSLMVLPNLIGLIVLAPLVVRETRHYLANDPYLQASVDEIGVFMAGEPGHIDDTDALASLAHIKEPHAAVEGHDEDGSSP
ncbi:MAG: sodium:alanine symporter family protein [Bowdeniella nasicola]|nr:sodium:alanine symporter family protein [Bowdeniella nasicola]